MGRQRRRAVRLSDAKDYDRSFDSPTEGLSEGGDGVRAVQLDDAGDEETGSFGSGSFSEEFYREQQPPHHG